MNEVLLALLIKKVEERFAEMPMTSRLRGPRGQRGSPGRDGKDFVFAEHEAQIREWAREFAVKFEDFTAEQVASLRGPAGRDGRDGKDFNAEEHLETWDQLAHKYALKFENLTPEQIGQLRGPQGRDGRDGADGKDFVFAEHSEAIQNLCRELVNDISENLKLKFSDLTAEDIEKLRGPRGRDGRDGKNFEFEEHRAFFESLKPKFSDFTPEEVESLRLHFSDLTEQERDSLKLRFSDLTDEDRLLLRGARGQRGRTGNQGPKGDKGDTGAQGPRGLPGQQGVAGRPGIEGRDGRDGRDGADAPYITDIRLEESRGEISFVFDFSDGTTLETNSVKLPHQHWTVAGRGAGGGDGGGGGGGGGGSGKVQYQDEGVNLGENKGVDTINFTGNGVTAQRTDNVLEIHVESNGLSAYGVALANGFVGTEEEWLATLVGPQGEQGEQGEPGVDGTDGVDGEDGLITAIANTPSINLTETSGELTADLNLSAEAADSGKINAEPTIEADGLQVQVPIMVGDAGFGGSAGVVPAPQAGDATKFLAGDGTYKDVPDQSVPKFQDALDAAEHKEVDSVAVSGVGAIEYTLAYKKGNVFSSRKLMVQYTDTGEYMSEWDTLAEVDHIGEGGADVETIWQSAVGMDIRVDAEVVGSDLKLYMLNNELSEVKVSGIRSVVPSFL